MGDIIPDYDRDRVYMSDIKKLVQWYHAVSGTLEYQAPATETEVTEPVAAEVEAAAADQPAGATDAEEATKKPRAKKKAETNAAAEATEEPAKKTAK